MLDLAREFPKRMACTRCSKPLGKDDQNCKHCGKVTCTNCGIALGEDDEHCWCCGKVPSEWLCTNCGTALGKHDANCKCCGKVVWRQRVFPLFPFAVMFVCGLIGSILSRYLISEHSDNILARIVVWVGCVVSFLMALSGGLGALGAVGEAMYEGHKIRNRTGGR
jgi:hypothetical protein